jgi:hypothetical protein
MDESQLLKTGKNQFSFSIEIQHADLLPPTVILPQHSISYYLSAEVKPSSLSERFKVTYRNASMNPLRRKNTQIAPILSSQHNSRSYSLPPTSALLYEQERPSFSDSFQESSSSSVEYNRRDVVFSQLLSHRTMKSLSASRSIQVCQHSYPSLALLYRVSRVRYHGSRQGRLKYRISMPKYACLQKLKYNFQCKFEPLCEEAIIKSVVYYIEQVESYP